MGRRIVITGGGSIAPQATGKAELMAKLKKGQALYRQNLEWSDKVGFPVKQGGMIDYSSLENKFNKRFMKQCDHFSIHALYAVDEAFREANINPNQCEYNRIGIYVGNSAGGWNAAGEGLYGLKTRGKKGISPFLASNWFPAAPQGHISINYQIKGPSKTVAGDMASSAIAIANACDMIKADRADIMIAGGSENIVTPWGLMFYSRNGKVNMDTGVQTIYAPFSRESNSMLFSDAAAFLILEEREHAKSRGAKIFGEITGYHLNNNGKDCSTLPYQECIRKTVEGKPPNLIYLNGVGYPEDDLYETDALINVFGGEISNMMFTCPRAITGHTYGAATALDMVIGCGGGNTIIRPQRMDDSTGLLTDALPEIDAPLRKKVLFMSRGIGGINCCIYVEK